MVYCITFWWKVPIHQEIFAEWNILNKKLFKRSLSERRFKKWLFSLISLILIILAKRVIFLNILLMRIHESQWAWMSLNKSEWVWMSLSGPQSVSENGEHRKILQHDRNRRYCREHSQKLHTNEKLHASLRLWSESHFRLVLNANAFSIIKFGISF